MSQVYLIIGSNLGDKRQNLTTAIRLIGEQVGHIVKCASFYESEPWGFTSVNSFLNTCVLCETTLSPHDVLIHTQAIERQMGRRHKTQNNVYTDRIIDIDILLYDDITISDSNLTLPHPLIAKRDFVIKPLKEIMK